MRKQQMLIGGGILFIIMLLVGALWGWDTVLEYLIGILLVALVVWIRYAMLKLYLKNYSLRTLLFTNPLSAALYSLVDSRKRDQEGSDLDYFFPTSKTQKAEESEELPRFHFPKAAE